MNDTVTHVRGMIARINPCALTASPELYTPASIRNDTERVLGALEALNRVGLITLDEYTDLAREATNARADALRRRELSLKSRAADRRRANYRRLARITLGRIAS